MPTHLTTTVDAIITAKHTYVGANGVRIGTSGRIVDDNSTIEITSFSDDTSLGTSDNILVTQNAIKTYADAVISTAGISGTSGSGGTSGSSGGDGIESSISGSAVDYGGGGGGG